MNRLLRCCGALLPMLLAGCSYFGIGEDNPAPPAELTDFEPQVRLQRLWSRDIGAGLGAVDMVLNPVLDQGAIFTADPNGRVTSVAADNGRVQWSADLDTYLTGGVGLSPELVLVGSQEGDLFALDRANGELRWTTRLSSEVLSAADGNAQVVVVSTQDGSIHALEASSGTQRWSQDMQKPLLTLRGNGRPLISGDRVYLGLDSGKVSAYRLADGSLVWEARVAIPEGNTELERMVDVDMQPLIFSDLIFAVSYNGGLMAIDLETGRSEWFQEGSSRANLAYFGGLIVATMIDSRVVSYSVTTGSQVWESQALLNRGVTGPAANDLFVAVGEREEGYLHLFNRRNGNLIGRVRVDSSGISAAPLTDGQNLYVLGRRGDLHAYRVVPL